MKNIFKYFDLFIQVVVAYFTIIVDPWATWINKSLYSKCYNSSKFIPIKQDETKTYVTCK